MNARIDSSNRVGTYIRLKWFKEDRKRYEHTIAIAMSSVKKDTQVIILLYIHIAVDTEALYTCKIS